MPTGIEELLAMAAVDPGFAAALQRDRDGATQASGVELSATERGILSAIDDNTLQQMTANMAGLLSEQDRRAFLGRSAAALVALFGGATAASGCECPVVRGTRPDPTQQARPEPPPPGPDLSRPNRADLGRGIGGLTVDKQPVNRQEVAPTGIRPDRPEPLRPAPPPTTTGIRPDRPEPLYPAPPPTTTGIRQDHPDRRTRGIRPDRPRRRSRE